MRHAGVFSAWGMGLAEARADAARTRVLEMSTSTAHELDAVFGELEREVTEALVAEGGDDGPVRHERSADMRASSSAVPWNWIRPPERIT